MLRLVGLVFAALYHIEISKIVELLMSFHSRFITGRFSLDYTLEATGEVMARTMVVKIDVVVLILSNQVWEC